MPLCAFHLIALSTDIPSFAAAIARLPENERPLITSKVIRWMITPSTPTTVDPLLKPDYRFDVLLVLPTASLDLPQQLISHLAHKYSFAAGIPSRIVNSFPATNQRLLHPIREEVPKLTGALDNPRVAKSNSTQNLEYTPALYNWATKVYDPQDSAGAVSMLNLLAFHDPHDKNVANYQVYGKTFAESIGKRRGGNAKIVGKIPADVRGDAYGWDEVALAHYPSIRHFTDMAASQDYQETNWKYRLPSLKDTCILMTSEIAFEREAKGGSSKL